VDLSCSTLIGFSQTLSAKANNFLALILQLKLEAIQKPFITQHRESTAKESGCRFIDDSRSFISDACKLQA